MIIEIHSGDGDVCLRAFKDDAAYLKAKNKELEDCDPPKLIRLINGQADLAAVEGILVIRGEIIELKPKETVKTWDLT